MLLNYKRGQGSIVLRVKILDSSVSTGAGKTGLVFNTAGLIISTIADNEATATAYTTTGTTIETVTTLGAYAAPTATKCRFREVDATNHKGVYEIQIADARFAVSSAKSLIVSILGASNAAETDVVVALRDLDPYLSALTTAQIATGVWTDTTAGDFTVALSVGKSLMNGVALGTGLTINTLTTKTGFELSAAGLNLVLIDGKTLPIATRIIAAAVSGTLSGALSGTEVVKGLDGTTTIATATIDTSGNRTMAYAV